MVEARFKVIGLSGNSPSEGTNVQMYGVQGEPFGKYTPSANCNMLIINPEAEKYFEMGEEYQVIFKKIKKGGK